MQALNDNNEIFNLTEPFEGLFTQGMVCHETYKDKDNNWLSPNEVTTKDGKKFFKKTNNEEIIVGASESMSKSKRNTIDPEEIIKNYGADAVRLFIMSDSPPEKDVQWSYDGMESSYRFIQKLWGLHKNLIEKINLNEAKTKNENIQKFTNLLINKINQNLENFRYNVIIANFYEMYNFLSKEIKKPCDTNTLIICYSKILILLSPFIPHFSLECSNELLKYKKINFNKWPDIDEKYLVEEKINLVIQINGKKREVLIIKKDTNENEILTIIKANKKINNFIKEKNIVKKIFVPNKILNLIIK